jgi:hypothetical protein
VTHKPLLSEEEREGFRDTLKDIRDNTKQKASKSRKTSLSLFEDQKEKDKVETQKDLIEEFLNKAGSGKTRKEIYHESCVDAQPSTISARLKSLINDGRVVKLGKRPCKCGKCDHNRRVSAYWSPDRDQ